MAERPRTPPQNRKPSNKNKGEKKPTSSLTVALGAVVFCIILTFAVSSNSSTVETLASLGVVAPAAESFFVIPGSAVGFNFLSIIELLCIGIIVWGLAELLKTVGRNDTTRTSVQDRAPRQSAGGENPVKKEKPSEQ